MCWNLILNGIVFGGGSFGRWLDPEGGALMIGVSVLIKETPESSFLPSTMWGCREKVATYEPGNGLSPDIRSAGILILDFPASRTVTDKCCWSHPTQSMIFCDGSLNRLTPQGPAPESKGGRKNQNLFLSNVVSRCYATSTKKAAGFSFFSFNLNISYYYWLTYLLSGL